MGLRVAVTGATGFSGQFFLPQLIAAGHDVVVLARNPAALSGKCQNVIAGDLGDEAALAALVAGADVVIHAGAATSAKSRKEFFTVNVEGSKRLFLAARAAKVRRFVYISSLAAREPGLSGYAASKAEAEKFLLAHDDEDCDVLVLRPPAIYGPGDRGSLPLFKMLQGNVAFLPGRASSRFSLLHVSDFAKVICDAVDATAHSIYELDDQSHGYSWADLAAANAALTGRPHRVVHLPQGLVRVAAGVAEAVARITGGASVTTRDKMAEVYHDDWVAHGWLWPIAKPVKMEEGLAQTLEWYMRNGWLPAPQQRARKPA